MEHQNKDNFDFQACSLITQYFHQNRTFSEEEQEFFFSKVFSHYSKLVYYDLDLTVQQSSIMNFLTSNYAFTDINAGKLINSAYNNYSALIRKNDLHNNGNNVIGNNTIYYDCFNELSLNGLYKSGMSLKNDNDLEDYNEYKEKTKSYYPNFLNLTRNLKQGKHIKHMDTIKKSLASKNYSHMKTLLGHVNYDGDNLISISIYCICVIDKLNIVVTGGSNGIVKIWSLDTGIIIDSIICHESDINDLYHVEYQGKNILFSCSDDGYVHFINLDDLEIFNSIFISTEVIRIVGQLVKEYSNKEDYIIVFSSGKHEIYFCSLSDILQKCYSNSNNEQHNLNDDSSNEDYYKIYFDKSILSIHSRLKREENNTYIKNIVIGSGLLAVTFTTGLFCIWDFDRILEEVFSKQKKCLINLIDYIVFLEYPHSETIQLLDYSKKQNNFISGGTDGRILIWEIKQDILNNFKAGIHSYKYYDCKNTDYFPFPIYLKSMIEYPDQNREQHCANVVVYTCEANYIICLVSSLNKKISYNKNRDASLIVYDANKDKVLYEMSNNKNMYFHDENYLLECHPKDESIILTFANVSDIIVFDILQRKIVMKYTLENYFFNQSTEPFLILEGKFSSKGDSFVISTYFGTLSFFSIYSKDSFDTTYYYQIFDYELDINRLDFSNENNEAVRQYNEVSVHIPKHVNFINCAYPFQQPLNHLKLKKIERAMKKEGYNFKYIRQNLFFYNENLQNTYSDRLLECQKEGMKLIEDSNVHLDDLDNNNNGVRRARRGRGGNIGFPRGRGRPPRNPIANNTTITTRNNINNTINNTSTRNNNINNNINNTRNNTPPVVISRRNNLIIDDDEEEEDENNKPDNSPSASVLSEKDQSFTDEEGEDEDLDEEDISLVDEFDNSNGRIRTRNQNRTKNNNNRGNRRKSNRRKILNGRSKAYNNGRQKARINYNEDDDEDEDLEDEELSLSDSEDKRRNNRRRTNNKSNKTRAANNRMIIDDEEEGEDETVDPFKDYESISEPTIDLVSIHNSNRKVKEKNNLLNILNSNISNISNISNSRLNKNNNINLYDSSELPDTQYQNKSDFENSIEFPEILKTLCENEKAVCYFCYCYSEDIIGPFYTEDNYKSIKYKASEIDKICYTKFNERNIFFHYRCLYATNKFCFINDDDKFDYNKTFQKTIQAKLTCYRCKKNNATLECSKCKKAFHSYCFAASQINQTIQENNIIITYCLNCYEEEKLIPQTNKGRRNLLRSDFEKINFSLYSFYPQVGSKYYFIPQAYEDYLKLFYRKIRNNLSNDNSKSNNLYNYIEIEHKYGDENKKSLISNNDFTFADYTSISKYLTARNNNKGKLYKYPLCEIVDMEYCFDKENCNSHGIFINLKIKFFKKNKFFDNETKKNDNSNEDFNTSLDNNPVLTRHQKESKHNLKNKEKENSNIYNFIFFPDNNVPDFLIDRELFEANHIKHCVRLNSLKHNDKNELVNTNPVPIQVFLEDKVYDSIVKKILPKEESFVFKYSDFEKLSVEVHYTKNNRRSAARDTNQLEEMKMSFWDFYNEELIIKRNKVMNINKEIYTKILFEIKNIIKENTVSLSYFINQVTSDFKSYYENIPVSISLNLIKLRLENNYYQNVKSFLFDVKQIYLNSCTFNGIDSDITANADKLYCIFKSLVEEWEKSIMINIEEKPNVYSKTDLKSRVNSNVDVVEENCLNSNFDYKDNKGKENIKISINKIVLNDDDDLEDDYVVKNNRENSEYDKGYLTSKDKQRNIRNNRSKDHNNKIIDTSESILGRKRKSELNKNNLTNNNNSNTHFKIQINPTSNGVKTESRNRNKIFSDSVNNTMRLSNANNINLRNPVSNINQSYNNFYSEDEENIYEDNSNNIEEESQASKKYTLRTRRNIDNNTSINDNTSKKNTRSNNNISLKENNRRH